MSKVIGFREVSFTGTTGEVVDGYNLFIATDIHPRDGEGVSCERIFVTKAKLAKCEYNIPAVDVAVEVMYNRYGKVADIRLA